MLSALRVANSSTLPALVTNLAKLNSFLARATNFGLEVVLLNKLMLPVHTGVAMGPPDRVSRCVGRGWGEGGS